MKNSKLVALKQKPHTKCFIRRGFVCKNWISHKFSKLDDKKKQKSEDNESSAGAVRNRSMERLSETKRERLLSDKRNELEIIVLKLFSRWKKSMKMK